MVPNMQLVEELSKEEGFSFNKIDTLGNLAEIIYLGKKHYFTYTTTPFNREDVQHICNDKFLTYSLLSGDNLMPETMKYLRPDLDPVWHDKIEFGSESEIVSDILKNFEFPFIVKMNAGSLGLNVFKCEKKEDVASVVSKIFKVDWALLAQEFVDKKHEYRVLIVNNSVELVYNKGGKGEFYEEGDFFEKIQKFLEPLSKRINLGWAGLDVILDSEDKPWLIEINTKPSLVSAIRAGKKEKLKQLYKKAFKEIF